jgi:TolB protein
MARPPLIVGALAAASLAGCLADLPVGGRYEQYVSGGSFVGCHPDINRDGARVAYATPRTGHGDIYVLDIRSGRHTRFTSGAAYEGAPSWSPAGDRLAFVREEGMVGHIWTTDADGRRQAQLTRGPQYDSSPAFAPDGKRIAFARDDAVLGRVDIYVMDLSGGVLRRLTSAPGNFGEPAWAADGRRIYCFRSPDGVCAIDVASGKIRVLCAGGAPAVSPDGRRVAYLSPPYSQGLSVMNADGSGARTIYHSLNFKTRVRWMPGGKALLFQEEPTSRGLGLLYTIDLSGQHMKRAGET